MNIKIDTIEIEMIKSILASYNTRNELEKSMYYNCSKSYATYLTKSTTLENTT